MKKLIYLTVLAGSFLISATANADHVNGYDRANGTYVSGYERSHPDGVSYNNYGSNRESGSYPIQPRPYQEKHSSFGSLD